MPPFNTVAMTRRRFATLLGAAAFASARQRPTSAQDMPEPEMAGSCASEPGVQLLLDWRQGLAFIPPEELVPPVD